MTKQKDNLTGRRFVLWDKIINQSVFLPAVGALEILKDMRDEIVARQQLTDLFKKIAEYGQKKGWANLNSSFRTMNWLTRRGVGRRRKQEIICRIGVGFRS